ITGANGSGKSTILRILAKHFQWDCKFLAVPYYDELQEKFLFKNHEENTFLNKEKHKIGFIQYSDGMTANLLIENEPSKIDYDVLIENKNNKIKGLFIHSHRAANNYCQVEKIPTKIIDANESYKRHLAAYKKHIENPSFNASPTVEMKESLISMAALGIGNEYVKKSTRSEKTFLLFIDTLRIVLPVDIGFENIRIEIPDVVLETKSGDFILDSTSGGIMSIIDIAWQILLFSQENESFTVIIDEPENHLHPAMQRTLLNNLSEAFPKIQFIVVTHSPFMVSSMKESNVYALKYEYISTPETGPKKVISFKLDLQQKAATANKILRDVLGVSITIPQWADDELQRICTKFTRENITTETLKNLRSELESSGLSEFYPEAIANVMGRKYHD
ncbi:AAA family ATPase, partial [Yersinia aldovae]|uniref:AAA family ATPase n=1 Tax=Yersinia aldovae TaxID=29483 RepID=UPI0011AADDCA